MKLINLRQIIRFIFATAFVLLLGMEQLRAATVNIDVSGSIVYGSGVAGVMVGDSFTASGSYDDAITATTITPEFSTYNFGPSFSVSLSAGSASYSYGNVRATVWDSIDMSGIIGAPYIDYYPSLSEPLDVFVLAGSDATGLFATETVGITFIGTADLFSGAGLPTSPMDFFDNPNFLGAFASVYNLTADSLAIGQASVVPVPAAVWLFASGLIALFGASRRRK